MVTISVKGMLLHGLSSEEVMRNWLASIKCEEYAKNFIENGYDMPLLSRMTPQDLAAVGCKTPALRKKLLLEIKKLGLEDDIPDKRPHSLEKWLELLKLGGYLARLCSEGYNTIDKVCDLTWEDLEDIGITKLGHQKRLLLGIERIRRFDKQQEDRNSCDNNSIYDVHPNYRVSLNSNQDHRLSTTINRATVRSGFFQTRSGANLDHRGLPIATVMPALKHVTNSLANLDLTNKAISNNNNNTTSINCNNNNNNQIYSTYQTTTMPEQGLKMSELSATIKRIPPPLPPVRTNSLKFPQDLSSQQDNIYGNSYGVMTTTTNNTTDMNGAGTNGYQAAPVTMGSTSFLRTPKLGTLTATTNKMLTLGGHIQTVNGVQQPTTIRSMPIREAPLPPLPTTQPPIILNNNQSRPLLQNNFSIPLQDTRSNLISPSLIAHQLAGADEFPPPPPSQ